MVKSKTTRKPPLKFIDRLENELKSSKIKIKRGGVADYSFDKNGKRSDHPDDYCEWVTIILKTKDKKKKYEIEFYFSSNSKTLESVYLYEKKKKRGYGLGSLIAGDKEIVATPPAQKENADTEKAQANVSAYPRFA